MLGAVGAFDWSGSVVQGTSREHLIFPKQAFDHVLQDRNHSSFLGEATVVGWDRFFFLKLSGQLSRTELSSELSSAYVFIIRPQPIGKES